MSFNNWYQFKVDPINGQYTNPSYAGSWLSLSAHDNNTEDPAREYSGVYNATTMNTWQMFDNVSYDNQSTWFHIQEQKISGLNITLNRTLIGNASIVWEYYPQTTSASCITEPVFKPLNLTLNTCGNLTSLGECSLEWTVPKDMGWCRPEGTISYFGFWSGYHIRARIMNTSGITQSPAIIINETKVRAYDILIPSGDTVTPKDLYDADMANGWGVVSQIGNMSYYVESNLFVVGTLDISHGLVLQVGDIKNAILGANYEIKTFVGSTLQMGELNQYGYGIYGGTLIYGNYPPKYPYFYWYCNTNIYDSTFLRRGGGYQQFVFYEAAIINWTNSNIESYTIDTLYLVRNKGIIKNVLLNQYVLYNYAPLLIFDNTVFGGGTINGYSTINWHLFEAQATNMDGYDMSVFANNKVTPYRNTDAQFTDSNYIFEKILIRNAYTTENESVCAKDLRSLRVNVIDSSTGNALENVKVTVLDNRNFSVLLRQNIRPAQQDSKYDTLYAYLRQSDSPKRMRCYNATSSSATCSDTYVVGDIFMKKTGTWNITSMSGYWAYVELLTDRNIGIPADDRVIGVSYVQFVEPYLNTTSEGYLPTFGEKDYEYVLLNRIQWADNDNYAVQERMDLNPHTFRFEKDGYVTQEFQLNVTTAVGDSWDAPLSLFVQMVPGSGSSSGAGDLFFIYDEDKRIFYLP